MGDAAQEHRQWLEQMEAASRAKQASFMDGIARKLKRPRVTEAPAHPLRGAPDFWNAFELTPEERIEKFMSNWQSVGGHPARLADMDAVRKFITDKAKEMGAHYLIRQNEPELAALDLEGALPEAEVSVWNTDADVHWKARSAEADFGVVMADYAAAYTGTVTVLSSKDKGRSVSLLPTVLMIIIPVGRLKTKMGEPLAELDRAGRENLPAGAHFISGPSRSSDIENDLTIGVHGPGIVYALIVG
ncbi:LutC/YkgG family protein [Cohnella zeiphila]|uniref:LUD domain-containing protein n=1 Tax=Cohnella zeiphila TaxID=2761120 RepID=A0A7X0SSD4_9BACL|nr:LUD domain-containing protein [Cohnella zeiphila]MBB6735214.1 LUD domain-containing protein [Cohnella zeiphila]